MRGKIVGGDDQETPYSPHRLNEPLLSDMNTDGSNLMFIRFGG